MDIRTAVNRAVNECINEGILRDFLLKNKSEVIRMSIFEYDEEREIQLIRESEQEIGFERGVECGIERGIARGIKQGIEQGIEQGILTVAKNMLLKQEPLEKIQEYSGLSKETILQLREEATYKL